MHLFELRLLTFFKVRLGYMYNFSLGMLCAVAAMAYTYVYVPDSRPIRDARLAKGQRHSQPELKISF